MSASIAKLGLPPCLLESEKLTAATSGAAPAHGLAAKMLS